MGRYKQHWFLYVFYYEQFLTPTNVISTVAMINITKYHYCVYNLLLIIVCQKSDTLALLTWQINLHYVWSTCKHLFYWSSVMPMYFTCISLIGDQLAKKILWIILIILFLTLAIIYTCKPKHMLMFISEMKFISEMSKWYKFQNIIHITMCSQSRKHYINRCAIKSWLTLT